MSGNVKRWSGLVLVAAFVWCVISMSSSRPRSPLTRGPYIQRAMPDSMVVVWRTESAVDAVVECTTTPGAWDGAIHAEAVAVKTGPEPGPEPGTGPLHSAPPDTWQYEAVISELEPDTEYFYRILDGAELLAGDREDFRFRTAAKAGNDRPLRLWVVGDSGTGAANQRAVLAAQQQYVATTSVPIDAFVHVGDMAYGAGTDRQFQERFFDVYDPILRNTVCWPTMGNHEGRTSNGNSGIGPYYDAYVVPTEGEAGGVPSGTEAYYSFDLGSVHFVCLNSYDLPREPSAPMARWLVRDLAATDSRWLIAFWHHPPYSMGTHNSNTETELKEMRKHIMPILEEHGVDLVLAGHSHIYERSMLIDGAYATPTTAEEVVLDDGDGRPGGDGPYQKSEGRIGRQGTLAVVTGHGGAGLGRMGTMPIMKSILVEHGSLIVDIDGDTLSAVMINAAGALSDEFQLVKKGTVTAAAVPYPWQPWGPLVEWNRDVASNQQTLAMTARPDAPDAVIHYTLDGSAPNLQSPRYEGPVVLNQTCTVQAFSVWGNRTSPITRQRTEYLEKGSYRIPIQASADDVEDSGSNGIYAGSSDLEMVLDQAAQVIGLCFRDVPLNENSSVENAYIQFMVDEVNDEPTRLFIAASSGRGDSVWAGEGRPRTRPRTTTRVEWRPDPWLERGAAGNAQRTPDLSAVIESLLAEDWQPGDSLIFLIEGEGKRVASSFDAAPHRAPILCLELNGDDS